MSYQVVIVVDNQKSIDIFTFTFTFSSPDFHMLLKYHTGCGVFLSLSLSLPSCII